MIASFSRRAAVIAATVGLAACTVGPDYQRPAAPVPADFKEARGWKPATPAEPASNQPWWSIYNDPVLDQLMRQVNISNQTLKADEAAYRNAQALVAEARAGFFPTLDLSGSATRSGGGAGSGTSSRSSSSFSSHSSGGFAENSFSTTVSAAWEPDIWGAIRRTVESDVASAQASAAELAAAQLSAQASLAADYFQLRVDDEESQLLSNEVAAFQRSLQITLNKYNAGTTARTDVATAQAQVASTHAQQIAVGVQRAQFEHAIAVLIGKPPADVSIAPATLGAAIPVTPPDLPSALLERNPTIASNERAMAAANARIGIAVAGYFPNVALGASYGQQSSLVNKLFTAASSLWSFGLTSVSVPVFNGGLTAAQVAAARTFYDETVANYRQAVLTVFQQVEDELAASRILAEEATAQAGAVAASRLAEQLALNQYRAGTVDYTTVVTNQATALSDEITALQIRQSRLVASVDLVEALGGGWQAGELPTRDEVEDNPTVSRLSPPLPP